MRQMKLEERIEIYTLLGQGYSQSKIAEKLGYTQGAISKEIKKGKINGKYNALYGQKVTKELRTKANESRTKLLHSQQWKLITEKLKSKEEDRSPDTIAGRLKIEKIKGGVCMKTMYNYIHKHDPGIKVYLRHGKKGYKTRGSLEKRGMLGNIVSIDQRPEEVNSRETFNHWEVDTMLSGTKKARLVTLLERKSRYLCIGKTSSGQATEVCQKIIDIGVQVGIKKFDSITSDNGKEFMDREIISYALQSSFFFAHPYHSRERGGNENGNRCIRKRLPKGFEFEELSENDIEKLEKMLNTKPRKILGYLTPFEVLMNQFSSYFAHYSF